MTPAIVATIITVLLTILVGAMTERTVREEDEGLTEREMDEERAADEEAEQAWKEERP